MERFLQKQMHFFWEKLSDLSGTSFAIIHFPSDLCVVKATWPGRAFASPIATMKILVTWYESCTFYAIGPGISNLLLGLIEHACFKRPYLQFQCVRNLNCQWRKWETTRQTHIHIFWYMLHSHLSIHQSMYLSAYNVLFKQRFGILFYKSKVEW